LQEPQSELLLYDVDGARRGAQVVEARRAPRPAAAKRDSRHSWTTHHQPRVVAEAALDDALDGDLVVAEDSRDAGQYAGLVATSR